MSDREYQEELIFERAAQIVSEPERAAYLDQSCCGDADLRARLEVLLEGHFKGQGFLEDARELSAEGGGTFRSSLPHEEEVGTVIGRYKLMEKVGEGGFGAVYVAEQHEPVKRRVALKIIKLGMDTRQVIARFEAERQALALMDHPNIAKVLDAGAKETGRPYFVMELVRGLRITDYCDQENLPTQERLDLFMQVCHAIQHAHQKGIIHRDIKPSNILVTVVDGLAIPKVIDFGIAKATHGQITDQTVYTQLHQFIGTPAYMSPEQAQLSGVDVDTRNDVYSLGVLLYELLTSRTPFDPKSLLAGGLDEMRRIIRETDPPRPSTRLSTMEVAERTTIAKHRQAEPAALSRLMRGDLDWIVMKCLEKNRSRRYETASALAQDIERHLGNEPIVARPPSKLYRLGKLVRRNKLAVAAGAAVAASLIIGLTLAAILFFRERTARRQADEQAAIAKAVSDFLQNDLLRQASSYVQADTNFIADLSKANPNLTVREALKRASEQIGNRFKDQPLTEAAIRLAIGDALQGIGLEAEAVPHLLRALELRQAGLGAEHPDTLDCMLSLGTTYVRVGKPERALPLLEKALKLQKARLGPKHPDTLRAMDILGYAYVEGGKPDLALPLLEQTVKVKKAALGLDDPETMDSMALLGGAYYYAGNLDQAVRIIEETLKLRKAKFGPNHPVTLTSINNLAPIYLEMGKLEQALPLLEQTLTNRLAMLGPDHPDTLASKHNLGSAYADVGKLDQAFLLLEEVLKTRIAMLGRDHPHTLLTMNLLANACQQAGRLDEAIRTFEEAVQLARGKLGPNDAYTLMLMGNLAGAYQEAGRLDQALPLQEETASLTKAKLGPNNLHTLYALGNLAWAYEAAGKPDRALPLLVQTLELEKAKLGPKHLYTLTTMNNLALAYQEAGKLDRALPLFEETLTLSKAECGPDHPITRKAVNDLAAAYLEAGKLDQALPLMEEALKARRTKLAPEHPDTMIALANLSNCLLRQGSYTNAEAFARECLELRQKVTPTNWMTFAVQTTLGVALLGQKKNADAEPLLVKGYGGLRERARAIPAGSRRQLREAVQGLVRLYGAWGKPSDAARWKRELELIQTPAPERPSTTMPFKESGN